MKAPAFQFYPQDFVSSLDVQIMTVEQVGGYFLLLINSWIQEKQGYLPDNEIILQRLCRMNDKQWSKNKDLILKKFKKDGEFIFNTRLIQELKKQAEHREKQALNGAKGGRPKAKANPKKAVGYSGLTQTEPKKSSSFSSSTSSTNNKEEEEQYDFFLHQMNTLTKRNFRGDAPSRKQVAARLKEGYTFDDFKKAILNCLADDFHKSNPKYLTPEFITRTDKLEKYLNAKDPEPHKWDKGCGIVERTQEEIHNLFGGLNPNFTQPEDWTKLPGYQKAS